MKLTFTWEKIAGGITPFCESSDQNEDGISLLACLLMDDGGRRYIETLSWIHDGLLRVDSVMRGCLSNSDWDREAWGAKIDGNEVKIYSLHNEYYCELIAVSTFRMALEAWENFIQSAPDMAVKKEISL
ncbi:MULTISPECIES: DUF5376 family protein [Comamonas]|uniref:DUF5376 family protein n=1 Tax=Comamonas TaxID=283 RepID=UPI000FD66C8E|nr:MULTISPECIES: DUF5376 family protein [Comamonas]MBD9530816.1 DUF5376 family protein [Comamonas sp. CMM01]BBL24554.1 hypothetical protein CT3_20090 [Comamonas terrigena NBRC 13299]